MKTKSKEEQLDLAVKSNCEKILYSLHDSQYMNVRRAVARNINISNMTANILSKDPVLNVSYMAIKNPKCTNTRDLSNIHIPECVMCEHDERSLDCRACENKKKSLLNF